MEEQEQSSEQLELTIIDKSIEVFKGGSAILISHQTRSGKAVRSGVRLIAQWEEAYKIEDPESRKQALAEADDASNNYLVKCSKARTEMMEDRKGITQLMDSIKEMFTEEENKMDNKKGKEAIQIQKHRETYAKWIIEENKRLELERQARLDKDKEKNELTAQWKNYIASWLLKLLSDRKLKASDSFNKITLEDYDDKRQRLQNMNTTFPDEKLKELILPAYPFRHHRHDELEIIKATIRESYDYNSFIIEYERQISDLKKELNDKLPSKKAELDEQETKRLEAIEEQKKRDEEIQNQKNEAEKKRLQQANEQKKRDEENRIRQQQADEKRRQDEETQRLKDEDERLRQKAAQAVEGEKLANDAKALFDETVVTETAAAPVTRQGFVIEVLHQAGWVLLFTFFYENEGVKLSMADWEKKTMKQIKTFAEKKAKEGFMIDSPYLKYEADVKVINKK